MLGRFLFSPAWPVYYTLEAPVKAGVIDEQQRVNYRPKIPGPFKRSRARE